MFIVHDTPLPDNEVIGQLNTAVTGVSSVTTKTFGKYFLFLFSLKNLAASRHVHVMLALIRYYECSCYSCNSGHWQEK
jgi:hypothetical protein